MESEKIGREGEKIYQKYREELESKYMGKIVAIDIDARKIATLGRDLKDANVKAMKIREAGHRLYFRKVGTDPITIRMR